MPSGSGTPRLLTHATRIAARRGPSTSSRGVSPTNRIARGSTCSIVRMRSIDKRIGFAQTGLGRDYHRLEQIGDAGIEQDLAPALRVVEIGEQAQAEMRRQPAHGVASARAAQT